MAGTTEGDNLKNVVSSQPAFGDLTQLKRDILVVTNGLDDPKGLEIKEELDAYYEESINHGRLYPNLDSLADSGYLKKFEVTGRSNGYRLTDTGQKLLRSRHQWEKARLMHLETTDAEQDTDEVSTAQSATKQKAETTATGMNSATKAEPEDILSDVVDEFDDL
jgi:DNA-binding PadR family transcriptional regulator